MFIQNYYCLSFLKLEFQKQLAEEGDIRQFTVSQAEKSAKAGAQLDNQQDIKVGYEYTRVIQ